MDGDKVEFRVVLYEEEIETSYSLTTVSQADKYIASVREAYEPSQAKNKEVRLKNGFLIVDEDHEGESDSKISCKLGYQEETKYKLVSNLKSEGDQLTKDDCLIALAYAAEHDDAKEVKELVQFSGQQILHRRMPFFCLGTILHVCTTWASLATLKLIKETVEDPEPDLVYMVDRDGDTALHNLPNDLESYIECKEAASLVLDLPGVDARKLLAVQNNYGDFTALCKALMYGKKEVCEALLDAAQKKEGDATTCESASETSHWLTLKARCGPFYGIDEDNLYCNDDEASFTAMHLAVSRKYGEIVIKMVEYPGATGLNLTSLRDHNDNTPLHVAAMIGDPGICMTLLKYDENLMNKDAKSGVRSENKADESALHTASTQGHAESGVRSKNKVGETALHIASTQGHAEVCERLLEYGASLSERDTRGRYRLTNAFAKGHNEVVEKLLDACLPSRTEISGLNNINAKAKANLHINEHFEMGLTPLHVAVAVSSNHHIQNLIKAGALVNSTNEDGRTPLHVAAAAGASDGFSLVRELLALVDGAEENLKSGKKEWINMKDICGQTALHYIIRLSSHSTKDLGGSRSLAEEKIADQLENSSEITKDEESNGHSAPAACCKMEQAFCETVRLLLKEGAWVDLQDCDGETSLHVAARSKHEKVVETLLSKATKINFRRGIEDKDKWICRCDFSGETALHEAAREGDLQSVRHLLKFTKRPNDLLPITDMRNRTAFDWAALSSKPKLDIMDEMMKCERIDDITKQVLLWRLRESITLEKDAQYCTRYQVNVNQTTLLQSAVETKNVDIARDLINKGADVTVLGYDDQHWLAKNLGKTTSDRPTSEDTLGRKELVHGVATLLLNPYTETPITIGIFGSWGVGKSSFMLQVEEAMLYMVVKETFKKTPDSLSHVKKSSIIKFSRCGLTLRYMVVKALKQRMMIKADNHNQSAPLIEAALATFMKALRKTIPNKDIESPTPSKIEDDIITNFPMELPLKYRQLFKSLALTDKSKLVHSHARAWCKKKVGGVHSQTLPDAHQIAYTPAVLTLHYNAWQYDNKSEASAGLAVEICHHLERFMTPHQWIRMCWRYSWRNKPKDIFVHLFLPTFLAVATICVILVLWKLTPIETKYKYLSLPMGILGVMWAFFKACLKVIQPVSQTMLSLVKAVDHQSMLGYQHQVIDDIKFLKTQLCEDANLCWKILSFFAQMFISNNYFVEGTWIWKQHPCLNNFQIVVFIDDLDRCEEKTILELLRAISVILGSCGINVVIGVDKDMVQRAITREFLKDTTENVFDMWVDKKIYPKVRGLEVMANVERKTTQEKRDSQNAKSGSSKIGNDDKYLYTSELAQNYLQKIIQLPIQMPDPSQKHIEGFLQHQVGQYIARLKEDKEPNNKEYKQKKSKKETGKRNVKEKQTNMVEHMQSKESIKENIEGEQVKDEEYLQGQERQMHDASKPVEFRLLLENYTPMEKETGKRNVKEKKINFTEHVQSEESIEENIEREQVKDEEYLQGQERQMHDTTSKPVEFRLLLANYTPMEKDMLKRLCQSTTKERRIPREWKRFFNYHRLAWTILSQDPYMESGEFKGWQRKLILWIFICWNWRAEMDFIFEKWHDILSKSSKWQAQKHLLQGKDNSDGISLELCDIICAYLESMGWSTKEEFNQNEVEQGYKVVPKAWIDLKNILKEEYDISMHFIEKFQQFRFYCILNHLEIGEQFKPKKVSLISIKSSLELNHKI